MSFKKILLASVFVAPFVANAALAADLPSRMAPPAPAPVYVAPPVFTWTGFYLGLNGGGSFSNSNITGIPGGAFVGNPAAPVYGARVSNNSSGFTGGATAGFNWQTGSVVFGLEGDIDYQNNRRSLTTVTTGVAGVVGGTVASTDRLTDGWYGTIRPRLGLAFGNALVYATGGLAIGDEKSSIVATNTAGDVWSGASSTTRTGWTLGGGLEYAVAPNWSIKGEYLYVDLGSHNYGLTAAAANPDPTFLLGAHERDRFSVVRVGINYIFR